MFMLSACDIYDIKFVCIGNHAPTAVFFLVIEIDAAGEQYWPPE